MKIIIGGAGAVGRHLARLLSKDHQDCVLIDEHADRLEGMESRYDIMTLQGTATSIQTLKEAGAEHADLFVGVMTNESRNMNACMIAHNLGAKKTVAMVENLDYIDMAESLDIGTIINKKTLAASHIYQMMLDANVSNVRSLMMVESDVAEFIAEPGSKVTKKAVKDLGLPFGVAIGGLVRGEQGILVNGNTQIEAGDSVLVFCHEQNLKKMEKYFKPDTLW